MSLQITPQISGQQANSTLSYSFLQEPLKVHITDSDADVTTIYGDVTRLSTEDGSVELVNSTYIHRDVASLGSVVMDLSMVMRQMHDYDTYKFASVSDIINGWDSVVSKYIYKFEFYTNEDSTNKVEVLKLPIIGGRSFDTFIPSVNYLTPIRELSNAQLVSDGNIGKYIDPVFTLKQISSVTDSNYKPSVSLVSQTAGTNPCEGVVYWKSKLGGWMMLGMDLKTENKSHQTIGSLDVSMFESTSYSGGGSPYVQSDYTGTASGLTLNLKALTLGKETLEALSEIAGSPAVYYQRPYTSGFGLIPSDESIELMRMTSAIAPIRTHIMGGDFSLGLARISTTEHKIK
tara:strand:- start:3683 stop:4720 length:1038 start_codon:yes stop_codon:yes gene_type:complete